MIINRVSYVKDDVQLVYQLVSDHGVISLRETCGPLALDSEAR